VAQRLQNKARSYLFLPELGNLRDLQYQTLVGSTVRRDGRLSHWMFRWRSDLLPISKPGSAENPS